MMFLHNFFKHFLFKTIIQNGKKKKLFIKELSFSCGLVMACPHHDFQSHIFGKQCIRHDISKISANCCGQKDTLSVIANRVAMHEARLENLCDQLENE